MIVKKIGDRYQVRVEELLPCPRFLCTHDLTSCATAVWCPDGCFDDNKYDAGICIPVCGDCVYYPKKCEEWRKFHDGYKHSALSRNISEVKQ